MCGRLTSPTAFLDNVLFAAYASAYASRIISSNLYDIGTLDGSDYLVMEFLEGETLAERLRKGAMPLNENFKIGMAVADALAFAHRQGILHRDLKPGNIMLTPGRAKLMDFGLAKPLSTRNAGASSAAAPSFTAAATLSGPGCPIRHFFLRCCAL